MIEPLPFPPRRSRMTIREFWQAQQGGRNDSDSWQASIWQRRIESPGSAASLSKGYVGKTIFMFSTSALTKTNRVRFFYGLKGRGGQEGIVSRCNGTHLGPGVIMVGRKASSEMERFLESFNAAYEKSEIWVSKTTGKSEMRTSIGRRGQSDYDKNGARSLGKTAEF